MIGSVAPVSTGIVRAFGEATMLIFINAALLGPAC
jgi:hypothetical protein